jgi:hypothetical protein
LSTRQRRVADHRYTGEACTQDNSLAWLPKGWMVAGNCYHGDNLARDEGGKDDEEKN